MNLKRSLFELLNRGYHTSFPLYRQGYSAWKSFTDREERRLLAEFVRPGALALDIGANIGVYTLFLSRIVGDSGEVHAFEPEPENLLRLQAAIRGRPNITAVKAAVGATSGPGFLYVSGSLNVDHQCYDSGEGRSRVAIEMISLDDYLDARPVSVIKVDVQGYEMGVLKGATRTLEQNSNILMLIEVWPAGLRAAGASADELIYTLSQFGFRMQVVGRSETRTVEQMIAACRDGDTYFNLVAVKP